MVVIEQFRYKVLISACLLGLKARYDGQQKQYPHPFLNGLNQADKLSVICPEMAGGLPVPRPAAERQLDGRILTHNGDDVSAAFAQGAQIALQQYQQDQAVMAILKEKSPSCGSAHRYDGSFSGTLIEGGGVTTALLRAHHIRVFSEHELDAAQQYYQQLDH